jgi:hypothetical protein
LRSGWRGTRHLAVIALQFVLAVGLAMGLGLSAGTERYLLVGVLFGGAAVLFSALNWRRHLIPIIFAYVCVEGFISLMFRHYKVSLLLKDFLIVIAYISLILEIVSTQRFVFFRGILVPMAVLGLIGIAEIFNPALPNILVGIVGFKILCFYMPMIFLGYYCFKNVSEARRFLRFLVVISVPVGLFALWQYSVGPEALTRFGQGFRIAVVSTPGSSYGEHLRAIGTFSASSLLAIYESCILVIGIILLGMSKKTAEKALIACCLLVALMGLLVSGTRGAMLGTGVTVACMFIFMRKRIGIAGMGVMVALAVGLIAVLLGNAVLGRLESLTDPAVYTGRLRVPVGRSLNALTRWPLGLGLGYASVGARHVMPDGKPLMLVENYVTKLACEAGWFGIVAFVWLVLAAMAQGLRSYRLSVEPEKKWLAGGLAVFLVGQLLLSFEGSGLDAIPLNVYFWFLLGVLLRVPDLASADAGLPPGALSASSNVRPDVPSDAGVREQPRIS